MGRSVNLEEMASENGILLLDNCVLGGTLRDAKNENSRNFSKQFKFQANSYAFWSNAIERHTDLGTAYVTSDIVSELVVPENVKKKMRYKVKGMGNRSLDSLYRNNKRLASVLKRNDRIIDPRIDEELYSALSEKFGPLFDSVSSKLKNIKKAPLSQEDMNLILYAATLSKGDLGKVSIVSNDRGVNFAWRGIVDDYSDFRSRLGFYHRPDTNSFVYGKMK